METTVILVACMSQRYLLPWILFILNVCEPDGGEGFWQNFTLFSLKSDEQDEPVSSKQIPPPQKNLDFSSTWCEDVDNLP